MDFKGQSSVQQVYTKHLICARHGACAWRARGRAIAIKMPDGLLRDRKISWQWAKQLQGAHGPQ